MNRELLHQALDELLDLLERHPAPAEPAPQDVRLYSLGELAELTNRPVSSLREACRSYEQGNPDGLKCMRETPGKKHSTLLVGLDWFTEWRDRQAASNIGGGPSEVKGRVRRALRK